MKRVASQHKNFYNMWKLAGIAGLKCSVTILTSFSDCLLPYKSCEKNAELFICVLIC